MLNFIKRVKNSFISRIKEQKKRYEINKYKKEEEKMLIQNRGILFDTALNSLNMGDAIIQSYSSNIIRELFPDMKFDHIQTHERPKENEISLIPGAKLKIVSGTNLITPHFEENTIWKMPENLKGYHNIITLGVGWGYYCDDISECSKFIYKTILHSKMIHSVRDSYTESQFRKMGFDNVINTGCPTLWNLSSEKCRTIPTKKAKNVICTITDYDRDYFRDRMMLDILLKNYDNVAVWIQGIDDQEYLEKIIDTKLLTIIPRNLEMYTDYLCQDDLDYVGTRLHAGIHALNHGIRSLIIAIDNRAIEMGRDFSLPILLRSELEVKLEEIINNDLNINIKIPLENIKLWKSQFEKEDII